MTEPRRRQVYLLNPRQLGPETIAVTFAKTSRSPRSFKQIADELTDSASAEFHEKWVVGYGHASVAEHAVLHIAFENVSRLAVEAIEHSRLASYTEKSTRYQVWDVNSFHLPREAGGSVHEAALQRTCALLMQAYAEALEAVRPVVQRRYPRDPNESVERWDGRIRSRYVDVGRFLLPAAVLANVGMTANARVLEIALRRMLSHPLEEVRAVAGELKQACQAEVPTLLKYADPVVAPQAILPAAQAAPEGGAAEGARLVAHDADGETRVLAALAFAAGSMDLADCERWVESLKPEGRRALAEALLGARQPHAAAPRALELASLTVEVVTDQGSYFELKRHRMMTQVAQPLTARLGFAVPRLIDEAGVGERYREAMSTASQTYDALAAWNPHAAAYVVPNGFYRRVLLRMNLREAFHFCELRAAENAHFSIRCIALDLAQQIRTAYPLLGSFLRTPDLMAEDLRRQVFAPA
jgi:thymidylate synthase ThyX